MKILVISRNAWDDTNSIGNTLTNFLQNLDNVEFANIYFRSTKPNNNVCRRYYRVTETEIIKKWFSPHKIGEEFELSKSDVNTETSKISKEKRLIRLVHKYGIKFAYKISNSVWYSKKWINSNLDKFVRSFSPDLVVSFVKSAPQYYLTIKHLRENHNIPVFAWIADDEYTSLVRRNSRREINNLRYILKESAAVRGCSEEICEYYNYNFGCNATPLYKGCEFSKEVKCSINTPVSMVYAGNLLYGRLDILKKIADALDKYTDENCTVRFEIYSNTQISLEDRRYFDNTKCTKYMGQRSYDIIKQRLSESDVVVHAESFKDEQILKTKYSFSTKIIDCLQSGSVMLAIGPSEISSIKYAKKIPGAVVIDNIDCLEEKIGSILDEVETFGERAKFTREFAQKHHDIRLNSVDIMETFSRIAKKGH